MLRIGVDTGGTFTDFVFLDGDKLQPLKLPSTPKNPAQAILQGLSAHRDEPFALIHGTTVSTNAFLQKKMAKTAFLCTKGFEHLLTIGRQNRIALFSLQAQKPDPLVPLSLCLGVNERLKSDGSVLKDIDITEIEEMGRFLKKRRVEAVAIVFLHSYRDPGHEQAAAACLRGQGFVVTASHEIMPEYREYERAVVTVLNSALKPVVADYVHHLEQALAGEKFFIIQSNGGILSPDRIIQEPIRTIISGPAGGVIAGRWIGGLAADNNLITLDMGGTSTDVSMIKEGEIALTRESSIENLPLRLPMINIVTVGAGGGSIARVDRGGVLQVGPESAAADPGPACYGKSSLATVTDAFVVMGAILPDMFLGGKMKIFPERSLEVIGRLAKKIGKGLEETAEGIVRISVSTMERALRAVTLEKGEDPRFFTLMPFGGAGGLVASMLTERLGITRILVPIYQGVFSALGMLVADFKKDIVRSFLRPYSAAVGEELSGILAGMRAEAEKILAEEGFSAAAGQVLPFLDVRYKGQSYELTIPYTPGFAGAFHQEHRKLYSYSLKDENCEIVNLRVLALAKTGRLKLDKRETRHTEATPLGQQGVYLNGQWQVFHIFHREDLYPGQTLASPAIVASADATVLIPANFRAQVDDWGNIAMHSSPVPPARQP